jgi:hypothetical protein
MNFMLDGTAGTILCARFERLSNLSDLLVGVFVIYSSVRVGRRSAVSRAPPDRFVGRIQRPVKPLPNFFPGSKAAGAWR